MDLYSNLVTCQYEKKVYLLRQMFFVFYMDPFEQLKSKVLAIDLQVPSSLNIVGSVHV